MLGIESATPVAAVALAADTGILAERMVSNKRTHSVNLLPMIKSVLEETGVDRHNLGGIAVSRGPGSFTGLRIGISTARALAQVWQVPVAGISTLEALAYPLRGCRGLLCPVLNARKDEVYTAIYDAGGSVPVCLYGPAALPPGELPGLLAGYGKPVIFLGEALILYGPMLKKSLGEMACFASLASNYPRGAAVAELGIIAIQEGRGLTPASLQPEYVRMSEAEAAWLRRNKA